MENEQIIIKANNNQTGGSASTQPSKNGSSSQNSSVAYEPAPRLPGIDGLFGEGFPELKQTSGNEC